MFTGIIESVGTVSNLSSSGLEIRTYLDQVRTGDSVSVNGVCLTVTNVKAKDKTNIISFDYTPETSGRTATKSLKPGSRVNLEKALKAGSRLGGHFVTGHVEGTGTILSIKMVDNSYIFSFEAAKRLMKYIVTKGSVAIDGISLTVMRCSESGFSVSVIPFSFEHTNLKYLKAGQSVNIETDIIAKYVENITLFKDKKPLTLEFLKEKGFI